MYDLGPIADRLRRAEEHLKICREAANRLWIPHTERVRRELEADGAQHVYYAIGAEAEVADISLIVSDCLHQLRAALDNLVHTVVLTNCLAQGKTKIPVNRINDLAFPICFNDEDFRNSCKKIWNVGIAVETIIENAQPYKALNPPEVAPLWKLRKLQGVDKHRFVLALSVDIAHSSHSIPTGYEITARFPGDSRFKDGAEVARFFVDPPSTEVDVEYQPALGISFDDPGAAEGNPVDSLLGMMRLDIEEVVTRVGNLP